MYKKTKTITVTDLRSHHINMCPYPTDMDYLDVAKNVNKLITSLVSSDLLSKEKAKDLAIRLTLHLEDTVADAGVWKAFCTEHHRLYGRWLPFQWDVDDMLLDEVTPQSCAFIIWMVFTCDDEWRYTSPLMPAIENLAEEVYDYFDTIFDDMPINDDMLHDLYSKDVLSDFFKTRNVLSWLADAEGCYLSCWDVTMEGEKQECEKYMNKLTREEHLMYQVRAIFPFKEKIGPLAVLAQEWYADMLDGYAEEDRNKFADAVRSMQFKRFDTYHIEKYENGIFTMRGVDNDVFEVSENSFGLGFSQWNSYQDLGISSFVKYNGHWEVNGIAVFQHLKRDFSSVIKQHQDSVNANKREIDVYQKFIDKNNGKRMYFFHGFAEMKEWHNGIIRAKDDHVFDNFPDEVKQCHEIMCYLPTDGGIEIAWDVCTTLCSDDNPFYDERKSIEESMEVIDTDAIRGECLRYIISSGMLKNLRFPGGDANVSYNLAQENLDFLARYYRRGIY